MPKRSLRQKLLSQRRSLTEAECRQLSRSIQQNLVESGAYRHASVVAMYAPIHNEVETSFIFADALESGKAVGFPRVVGHALEFIRVPDASELRPGAFGIFEPSGSDVLPTADIDLMLVPVVGFDRLGYRLGYGRGYYDRVVAVNRPRVLAGMAYAFQVIEELPYEDHDIRLDLLVMESDVLAFE